MQLSKQEEEILDGIKQWEYEQNDRIPVDITRTYDEWLEDTLAMLPEDLQEKLYTQLDQWIFFIQAAVQQSESYEDNIKKLINDARIYEEQIETIQDLKQLPISHLNFLADKQTSVHKLYSLIQGGLSGSGSTLFLGFDIPAMTVINLRSVQLIAASYGFDTKNPFEMMIALKVFYSATLPKRFQREAWDQLIEEITDVDNRFFYEGKERIFHSQWLTQLLMQMLKGWGILLFRKKKHQNIPFLSIAIGASVNYSISKNVTEFAKRFYQYRYIIDKEDKKGAGSF